jgi:transposase-like protein
VRVLAGTIFQDTHLKLTVWFKAVWLIVSQKFGTNAMGLHRTLDIKYETAWNLLHKLRRAMIRSGREKLNGTVEIDECFIGASEEGVPGRGAVEKRQVLVAVELKNGGKALGRIRLKIIEDASAESILPVIRDNVEVGSTIITDGWKSYFSLKSEGYTHEIKIITQDKEALPHVHLIISLLKRWLIGTLQGGVSGTYLDYYLDEYVFRFNQRTSKSRGKLFHRLIEQAVLTPPVTRQEIREIAHKKDENNCENEF